MTEAANQGDLSAGGSSRVAARQRARILEAMVTLVGERGFAAASVGLVTATAKVSSRTFYERFDSLQDCFLALIDEEADRTGALVRRAFARERDWRDGLRAALASLLVFLDSEPLVARVWLVEVLCPASAPSASPSRRGAWSRRLAVPRQQRLP